MKNYKAKSADDYIVGLEPSAKQKFEEIRRLIRETLPQAEEKIWYGVPFYFYHGEVVGIYAYPNHISFGIGALRDKSGKWLGHVITEEDRKELEKNNYKVGAGTIQIKLDQEAPKEIIKKLLNTKAQANEQKG